jgi:vanillate O-demethylase ferredoxin subunit
MSTGTPSLKVRVQSRTVEAQDIVCFELVSADGKPLPAFSAGSHIDVPAAPGITRQYSLCNAPGESNRYQIAVLREPASRGGSAGMHERLKVGDVIEISAPRNHFPLAHEATKSLLLAGGIGVTPILCMAERLSAMGAAFEMHYCTRSKERMAFVDRIQRSRFADQVRFHVDDGPPAQKLDIPALLATPEAGTHLYVCGPKGFMDAVLGTARDRGWPASQLHCEYFSAEVTHSASDQSFEVQIASTGQIVIVPSDKTVVQALTEAGVEVQTSCEQGVCGTCLTRVLEGEPDHRDMYLTPEEQAANDQFTPCCSRAKSARLVLDL